MLHDIPVTSDMQNAFKVTQTDFPSVVLKTQSLFLSEIICSLHLLGSVLASNIVIHSF